MRAEAKGKHAAGTARRTCRVAVRTYTLAGQCGMAQINAAYQALVGESK